jgi:hypothetical protein
MEPAHLTDSMLTRTPLDASTPKAQSLTAQCGLLRYPDKGWRPGLGLGGLAATPHQVALIPILPLFTPRTPISI